MYVHFYVLDGVLAIAILSVRKWEAPRVLLLVVVVNIHTFI